MIFWIFVILMVVGLYMVVISNKIYSDGLEISGGLLAIASGVVALILLVVIVVNNVSAPSMVAENHEKYKALTYKLESGACRDEFGLLNKEIIDEIQEWNEDVAYYQVAQDNFWIGILYPNVYDQFKTIDYTKYNTNGTK